MHCSDEALRDSHDVEVRSHLRGCMPCQQRLWQLKQLKSEADKLPLFQPNEMAWQQIKATLPQKKKPQNYKLPLSIAASFVVGIIVTFVGNNVWQNQLIDIQIAKSGQFEKALVSMQLPSPLIDNDLWKIAEIDEQLNSSLSKSEKKELWQKRNLILQRLLKLKDESREII